MSETKVYWVIDQGEFYLLGSEWVIQRDSYSLTFAIEGNCAWVAPVGWNFVDDGIGTGRNFGVHACSEQSQGNGVDEGLELHDSIKLRVELDNYG